MIISRVHRYLFVAVPHTASSAISAELQENYAGVPILRKHAHLHEFMDTATPTGKDYFVFAAVRNPLDAVISAYFKKKTNHGDAFTAPERWQSQGGYVSNYALQGFNYVQKHPDDFAGYLRKFYRIPYDGYGSIEPGEYDFMIRFENLQEDFSRLLALLSIEQVRPLPLLNQTAGRKDDCYAYYTPDTWEHVRRIFGPYLKEWGYRLPSEDQQVPYWSEKLFRILRAYRRRWVWRPSPVTDVLKRVRDIAVQYV